MRLAFLGTPEAAVPTLDALLDAGHDVALVVTRPDRRRGRGGHTSPSPVKQRAIERSVPVAYELDALRELDVERAVVVAYGALIPPSLLAKIPMLNVHFSLLPRWRGAAPVQRAVLGGDVETGVSIMTLEASLDTGPIHLVRRVATANKNVDVLTRELAEVGASILLEVLASQDLLMYPWPQEGPVTYASKITSQELRLTSALDPAAFVRVVRLGGAHLFVGATRLGVHDARSSDVHLLEGQVRLIAKEVVVGLRGGSAVLERVQPSGSSRMSGRDWWSGQRASNEALTWS